MYTLNTYLYAAQYALECGRKDDAIFHLREGLRLYRPEGSRWGYIMRALRALA